MKKGFVTLESMGVLLVVIFLLPILAGWMKAGLDFQVKRAVADHFVAIQQAAILYGKQNHHLLMPQVTQTSGPAITVAMHGQRHRLAVRASWMMLSNSLKQQQLGQRPSLLMPEGSFLELP